MTLSTPQPLKVRLKIRRGTILIEKCERLRSHWIERFLKLMEIQPRMSFLVNRALKWALWAIKHLQYPSFVSGPIDSTTDDTIEHYNTQNFHCWSLKSLLPPKWNVGMWKSREFPVLGNLTASIIVVEWMYLPLQRLCRSIRLITIEQQGLPA